MKVLDALSKDAIDIEDESKFREIEEAAKAFPVVEDDVIEYYLEESQ